jgi:hypothetical protein
MKGAYIGAPSFSAEGIWGGAFTATPTLVLAEAVTPSDGSEWTSPWVEEPGLQVQADAPFVLSYGITNAAGITVVQSQAQTGMGWRGAGQAAKASAAAIPTGGTLFNAPALDVRFEYETVTTLPIVLIVGDSFAAGQNEDTQGTPAFRGVAGTWPGMAGNLHRFLPVNIAIPGSRYSEFADTTKWSYQRVDLATSVPDAVILAHGLNELGGGITAAAWAANLATVVAVMKALGIKRRYLATIPGLPSATYKIGNLTEGVPVGVSTLKTSIAYANGDVIYLDTGQSTAETLTVAEASTGNGPYETKVTTPITKVHRIGSAVGLDAEKRRTEYNLLARRGVQGVSGIFDFANAIPPEKVAEFWHAAASHPGNGAYALFAAVAAVRR